MPTGYTANIAKGITFPTFAMNCARAFGALISMRDDPADTPIPEEFAPSNYNQQALAKNQARLADLLNLTTDECAVKAQEAYEQNKARYEERIRENEELHGKYKAMLAEVNAWEPPTSEHVGLKNFMREQIESSIEYDCDRTYYQDALSKLKQETGEEWRAQQIADTERSIAYHTKQHAEEVERDNERTQWVKQLRASLQP